MCKKAFALTLVCLLLVGSSCQASVGKYKPPHVGVFVLQGRELVEIPKTLGGANKDMSQVPQCDSRPVIYMWYPEVNLDLLLVTSESTREQIPYDAVAGSEGILKLTFRTDLKSGLYSIVQGNPMMPASLRDYLKRHNW